MLCQFSKPDWFLETCEAPLETPLTAVATKLHWECQKAMQVNDNMQIINIVTT